VLTALFTTRYHLPAHLLARTPIPLYSQARFLESPSRAWNECGLASRALVAAASPLFALGVAFKCEASVELNQTALSSVAPASACTRGVPIRYSPNLSNTHAHMHMHMHMCMCMLHVHAHLVTDHRACISRCGRSYVKRAISRRFVFGGLTKEAMIGTGKTTPNRLWWRCFPAYIALLDRL